ncbi:MAG: DNA methyltransferase, partial [Candidatus Saccharimonadales bacterium]
QVSSGDIEGEVYSHLTDFFGRYYDGGDFISQRRYKDGVYAIPYQGEEVKLYWANQDQYYIKTSENFKNFSFLLSNAKKVTFTIVDAETEKDNNKAGSDKERRFILAETDFLEVSHDELLIKFEYKPSKEKQDKLTKDAVQRISNSDLADDFSGVLDKAPTEKNASRTVLEKWLTHYTSKNTFDYFIHKDLRGFLGQELDFYIKNEMFRIDDLDALNEEVNTRNISKIKAFKHIAKQIVNFLSQLEDFQKLLWEKKKFVVQSDYILTLDYIDVKYYEEILNNNEQIVEWKKLGFIDDSTKPDLEYLNNNQGLQVDTKYFPNIKNSLVSDINDIDNKTTGVLINADNFHALNILESKYRASIDACYIDPPYNTNATEIIYKNGYKQSSWMSLMNDRIQSAKRLLAKASLMTVTIDDYEQSKLTELLSAIFGQENQLGIIAIRINPKGRMTARKTSLVHEYAIIYGNSYLSTVKKLPQDPSEKTHNYKKDIDGTWFLPVNLRKQGVDSEGRRPDGSYFDRYYPIYVDSKTGAVSSKIKYDVKIMPIDSSGQERIWRRGVDVIDSMYSSGDIWATQSAKGWQIYFKFRGGLDGKMIQSMWTDSKYSASDHGTRILDSMLGAREQFSYPKSPYAVEDNILSMTSNTSAIVLDFFAGSGTTGQAVISLNRKDNGSRKYVLVEMGEYFDTVTKPRIQKAAYSDAWENGHAVESSNAVSQIIQYKRLESYEDALNNIKFAPRTSAQELLLDEDSKLRQDYTINYMLNFESEGSDSLVNLEKFEDPFNYTLNIVGDNNEIKTQKVDLVDTFNYLIGLKVERIEHARGFVVVEGHIAQTGEKTLVVWRNTKERSNSDLNDFLEKSAYNPADNEFSIIYVNGDN